MQEIRGRRNRGKIQNKKDTDSFFHAGDMVPEAITDDVLGNIINDGRGKSKHKTQRFILLQKRMCFPGNTG